jgi:iron-sulfur cluster repair protein YtfE (RIC family)
MSKIQTLKKLTSNATIHQIISAEKSAEVLLISIGLSPENHRSETLRSVCQQKKWSEVEVLKWLKKNCQNNSIRSSKNQDELPDFGNDLSQWCHYVKDNFLIKNHKLLDEISNDFTRVHRIHGNQYEWLKDMHWYLEHLEEKLNYYFNFQRHKLFPLLDRLKDSRKKALHGTIKKINNGIEIIKEDQSEILDLINTIKKKGKGLEYPEGACSTLRILNNNIKTLFSSLRKQIEIERKHLIPLIKRKLEMG